MMKKRILHFIILSGLLLGLTGFGTKKLHAQTWQPLSGNVSSLPISAGNIYYYRLTGDVNLTTTIAVYGTLHLDLNGYVLKRSDHKNFILSIYPTGVCTLTDSRPNTSHYGIPNTIHVYDDDFDYLWDYDASYTANTPGSIEIKGGIITGGIGQTGGAVYVKGVFNMQGGTIAGNFIYCHPFKVKEGSPAAWVEKIKHPWKWDGQCEGYTLQNVIYDGCDTKTGCYNYSDDGTIWYYEEGVGPGFQTIQGEGGGVWVGCGGTFNMTGGRICYNYAALHGGGVYCAGVFNMTDGLIDNNYCLGGYGAGVFINRVKQFHPDAENGLVPVGVMTMDGGEISDNTTWGGSGGGIMAWKGKGTTILTINNGTFRNNESLGNRAPGSLGNGGAVYGEACDMIIKNIEVHGNYSDNYGGGIYLWAEADLAMDQGICNITGNSSKMGGGGLCLRHERCTATLGPGVLIEDNTSVTEHGGGFSMKGISLTINGAKIRNNHAELNGGGLYVDVNTAINLEGNTEITGNSADGLGGGVYFENSASMTVGTGAMNIRHNTVAGLPNNIYLLKKDGSDNLKTIAIDSEATFNPEYIGVYTENRTPNIPVFTGTSTQLTTIFNGMIAGNMHIYDDSQQFNPINPNGGDTLYFGATPWSPLQQTARASDLTQEGDVYLIGNVKQLTAFLWKVNGIATHETSFNTPVPNAKGKLTADINMDSHYWVPIGNGYTGIFDGNGYTISNLTMVSTNVSGERGMFGVNTSGTIKNIILKDCYFASKTSYSGTGYLGAIVSQNNGGTLSNSVAHGTLIATTSDCIVGGVAGANNGTVHSCYAALDMTGYQMGGLVGSNSGNLYNSFANAKFEPQGTTNYIGGLVGVNTGRVENCYSRVQGTAPTSTYFGWLAGNNTSASGKGLYYCYSPNATYVATVSGTTSGNQTGLSTFGITVANAYEYRVRDNQVAATNDYAPTYDSHHLADYQLKKYLNKWVDTKNGSSSTYAGWTRPTTQAINDDYPLLKLQGSNAVAATSGEVTLDYGDINSLLTNYATADNSILFYGSKEGMDSNSGLAAPLYIDEDAVLTPSSEGDIVAHVGVTIDNSACHDGAHPSYGSPDNIDWHFFSSVLTNAQIGLDYENPEHAYSYWDNPPDPQFTASSQYFPMNLNNYYREWDLYSYCERDYHWINLKRNSFSHWHEDADWVNIPYTNETVFNPGQGFMVALKEEGYLQAYGTLNNTSPITRPVTCTSGISWTTRQGQNLLGNPYQSYLDFDAFANDANNKNLWSSSVMPFYIIMDEDQADYVTYTKGQTANEARASRYLHPHQGFMIKINNAGYANFNNIMRKVTMDEGWSSTFRGDERPNYALVNLFAKDASGNRDMVTVELGRPEAGGLKKSLVPGTSTGRISCHYEDEDYDLAFTKPGITEASIHFKTEEDTEYTMTWSTQHGDFGYLHLIDNMTGADIDCLATDEYKFSSRTSDYESRFRLVFGYTGIEEPEEDGPSTGSGTCNFAFMMGGQLVVNGEGTLQMFDVTGRLVSCTQVLGEQNTVSLPTLPAGVYMLRLEGGNGTQTQKIVIR